MACVKIYELQTFSVTTYSLWVHKKRNHFNKCRYQLRNDMPDSDVNAVYLCLCENSNICQFHSNKKNPLSKTHTEC